MNETEFLEKMELTDAELAKAGVPIYARFLRAFDRLVPNYRGELWGYGVDPGKYPPFVGPNLMRQISDWFGKRYGERSYLPSLRGRIPIILRREVYLIRIPAVFGRPRISVLPLIDGLTKAMAQSLTPPELELIRKSFENGFALTHEIEDLMTELGSCSTTLSQEVHNMLRNGIEDRDTSVRCLSGQLDTNGACFHAQQHAEKMLKSYLMANAILTETQLCKRPYGHELRNIFHECTKNSNSFLALANDIALLGNIRMDIRYTTPKVEPEVAVEAHWAALRTGALCACEISGHKRRYKL